MNVFDVGDIIKVNGGQYNGLVGEIVSVPDDDYHPYGIVAEGSNSTYWFKRHELELVEPTAIDPWDDWEEPLTFNKYQEESKKTAFYPSIRMNNGTHAEVNFVYPMLGLGGECGELQEKMKKIIRDKNGVVSESDKLLIAKELGDLCWYISQICTELGISYEEIHTLNLEKLADRQSRGKLSGSGDNR